MTQHHSESGSIFFYILLAILLLATLSFLVASGNRFSSSSLTSDQARLGAQEIIDYSTAMSGALQKIRLRGCLETQLDFTNNLWTTHGGTVTYLAGHNPTAIVPKCAMFDHQGASLQAVKFTPSLMAKWPTIPNTNAAIGAGWITTYNVQGVGTAANDLVYLLPTVGFDICTRINDMLGIVNPANTVPNAVLSATPEAYNGTFAGARNLTTADANIIGKNAYCAKTGLNPQDMFFIQVLIAR